MTTNPQKSIRVNFKKKKKYPLFIMKFNIRKLSTQLENLPFFHCRNFFRTQTREVQSSMEGTWEHDPGIFVWLLFVMSDCLMIFILLKVKFERGDA